MSVIIGHIRLARPHQWIKNLMIFFPPLLAGSITSTNYLQSGFFALLSFSLLSSTIYIFNDLSDIEADRSHPQKKLRPLPSGTVSKTTARVMMASLLVISILLAALFASKILPYLFIYGLVSILYSFSLKNIPVVELFCISSGFIVRLLAGGAVFAVNVSEWLFLSVFLLSIFLSSGKRLGEVKSLGSHAGSHRKVLTLYPGGFLDSILILTGSSVLVTYSMYAVSRHSVLLLATVPLCCFGLMRYVLRVKSGGGGDPTESLLSDSPLLITGIAWALLVGWGIYGG